jgi:nicotinamidase/pyrazinamidase
MQNSIERWSGLRDKTSMTGERSRDALIVADLQMDFLPGGALAIAGGNAVLEPIASLMRSGRFDLIVVTQDWHPAGHVSFASSHTGREPFESITLYGHPQVLWPDHCVVNCPGAALHSSLPWEKARAFIRKGSDPAVDSYSAFRNNWDEHGRRPPTGLGGYLKECGVTDVYVCGLARDFCVKWTAEDAVDLGFRTHVLWDLTRPVNATDDGVVRTSLIDHGVEILESTAEIANATRP